MKKCSSAALRRVKRAQEIHIQVHFLLSITTHHQLRRLTWHLFFPSCHRECKVIRASEAQHKGRQGQLGKTSNGVTVATSQTERHHFVVGSMQVSGRVHEHVYTNVWAEFL